MEEGESLWGIARRYDVTVDALKEANDLGSRAIQPGEKLRVPRASASSSSSERSASSERSSTSSERSARRSEGSSSERSARSESGERSSSRASSTRPRTRSHTVQDGETLWGIARRYDVTVDAVKSANELGSRPIQPGQTLRIPAANAGRD